MAMSFVLVIYLSTQILSLYLFGSSMDSNVLDNIAEENLSFLSVVVRLAFAIVIACHIPYVFFYGKQGILILIDEVMNNSTSQQL